MPGPCSRYATRLHAAEVVDAIDHDAGADRDHQDIAGHPHVLVAGRRHAEAHHDPRGQIVDHHVARQRPAELPFPGLAGRHAAVVLLREPRRAMPTLEAVRVILAHDFTLAVAEMHAHPDVAPRFSAIVVIAALHGLVRLAMTGPVRFVGQDWAGREKAGHEQGLGFVFCFGFVFVFFCLLGLGLCVRSRSDTQREDTRIPSIIRPACGGLPGVRAYGLRPGSAQRTIAAFVFSFRQRRMSRPCRRIGLFGAICAGAWAMADASAVSAGAAALVGTASCAKARLATHSSGSVIHPNFIFIRPPLMICEPAGTPYAKPVIPPGQSPATSPVTASPTRIVPPTRIRAFTPPWPRIAL